MRFREDRTAQAAAVLLNLDGGSMSHMKLIKLLYLADRRSLLENGRPITFDHYYSLPHGPVLSFTLNCINGDLAPNGPGVWNKLISERNNHTVRLKESGLPPRDLLSVAEIEILEKVFGEFGQLNQWELRDLTHKLPEWQDPKGSCIPIDIRTILLSEGFDEEDVAEVISALDSEELARESWM